MQNSSPLAVSSRSQALRTYLEGACLRLGPGAKMPRMADLCAELGTSPTTLNKVLVGMESDGLLTRRHGVGVFVAENAPPISRHLALVCRPSFLQGANHSPMWDLLLSLLEERAQQHGAGFDSYFSRENDSLSPLPRPLMREVESGQIGGVLGVGLEEEAAAWLMKRVPVVNLYGKGHVIVRTDAHCALSICVNELKRQGRRRIGLWMPSRTTGRDNHFQIQSRRFVGKFEAVLNGCGLPFDANLVRDNAHWFDVAPMRQPALAEQGYQTACAVASDGDQPDGVICLDDVMTRGALIGLREAGIKIGAELAFASTANAGSPTLMGEKNLILAEYDPAEVAASMWREFESLHSQTQRGEEKIIQIPARLRLT